MLSVVLYGCETRSLTLREGRKLRVRENGVLGKIFGPKSDGVTGKWRKLHNTELCDLYCSTNIIRAIKLRRIRWAGHVARMVDRRDAHGISVGKRTLAVPRSRWKFTNEVDRQEIEWWLVLGLD